MVSLKHILPRAHSDECSGSELENYKHVTKEQKIYEEGTVTGNTGDYKNKIEINLFGISFYVNHES